MTAAAAAPPPRRAPAAHRLLLTMDGREDAEYDCQAAFAEARRWLEAVTRQSFGTEDFRAALENGVLLCDLINKIKPGIVKKINRLPTPIAGLTTKDTYSVIWICNFSHPVTASSFFIPRCIKHWLLCTNLCGITCPCLKATVLS